MPKFSHIYLTITQNTGAREYYLIEQWEYRKAISECAKTDLQIDPELFSPKPSNPSKSYHSRYFQSPFEPIMNILTSEQHTTLVVWGVENDPRPFSKGALWALVYYTLHRENLRPAYLVGREEVASSLSH